MNNSWLWEASFRLFWVVFFAFWGTYFFRALLVNYTMGDDTKEENDRGIWRFRDKNTKERKTGEELRSVSYGEAWGYVFLTYSGVFFLLAVPAVICLIFANAGSTLPMDMLLKHAIRGTHVANYTDWPHVNWLIASMIAGSAFVLYEIVLTIMYFNTRPKSVVSTNNAHGG